MEKYAIPNKLPSKQVNILAQRKGRISKPKVRKGPNKALLKKEHFQNKFKKPEFFIANFRKAERDDKRVQREILRNGISRKFMKDNSLVLVFRHRGTFIASEQCNLMLQKLGLQKLHQAKFLKMTDEVKMLLSLVEPYVIYGHPSIQVVRDLIYKYGFIKYKNRKSTIKSNTMIEEMFGEKGIICVEDLIHEISTVGANFETVNSKMCPFVLPNPQEGWMGKKGVKKQKGGLAGFYGEDVNSLMKTIL